MLSPTAPGPTDRLTLFFRRGSDSRRAVYARARRVMNLPVSRAGGRLARESAAQASFTIPREAGFALLPPSQFESVGEVVAGARELLARFDPNKPLGSGQKPYRIDLLRIDPEPLTTASPFLAFALRPDILAAIAGYLGVAPLLTSLQVWYSPPRTREPQGSQLYHCDYDDTSQVKIFVLCTDVGLENGPLTFLSAETSSLARRRLGYQYEGENRLTDEQVYSAVSKDDCHLAVGPAGTSCFLDVSRCLHYGSRVGKDADGRLLVMIQFKTPFSFTLPLDARNGAPFRHVADPSLPPLARAALTGEYAS